MNWAKPWYMNIFFQVSRLSGDITCGPFDREIALKKPVLIRLKRLKLWVKNRNRRYSQRLWKGSRILKEVAEKTGINIICSSGYYYEGEGAPAYFKQKAGMGDISPEIYEMLKKEVTEGIAVPVSKRVFLSWPQVRTR